MSLASFQWRLYHAWSSETESPARRMLSSTLPPILGWVRLEEPTRASGVIPSLLG